MTAILNEYRKEQFWREYMAVHVWYAAKGIQEQNGYELKTPNYAELMHPAEKKEEQSAEQITGSVLEKLKG